MLRNRRPSLDGSAARAALLSLWVLPFVACGGSEDAAQQQAQTQEWQWLETTQQELQQKRAELQQLESQVEAGAAALQVDEASGQTAEQAFAELEARASALEAEIDDAATNFMSRLVAYINSQEMEVGAAPTEQQSAALRMKSGEDIVYAMEYVERGGDYARAEEIVQRAAEFDPDNPTLQERLDWIRSMRYINRERFDQVAVGMTEAQVRELLGPVNINNIRDFPNNRKGWFYRKDPAVEGGAAGVYFEQRGGRWVVYEANYAAIAGQSEAGD
jgi:tetratricopeptide (TPR) repeat protein